MAGANQDEIALANLDALRGGAGVQIRGRDRVTVVVQLPRLEGGVAGLEVGEEDEVGAAGDRRGPSPKGPSMISPGSAPARDSPRRSSSSPPAVAPVRAESAAAC